MSMTLRTRILLGYGLLVTLLVVSAGGAALAFNRLGRSIDVVLRQNFASIRSSMGMLEALERHDSATLAVLLGRNGARELLASSEATFRRHLEEAAGNLTEAEEGEIIARLRDALERYVEARDALLLQHPDRLLEAYDDATFRGFQEVKKETLALLDVNHRAMVRADRDARTLAVNASIALAALVAVALLSLGALSANLQRSLLDRLAELAAAARVIGSGDRSRRVRATGDDELAMVARQLNRTLDEAEELERSVRGQLIHQRQLVLALLDRQPAGAAVVGLDGALVASSLPEAAARDVDEASPRLRERAREMLLAGGGEREGTGFSLLTSAGARVQASLLVAQGKRPVGWLVTVESPGPAPGAE